MDRFDFSYLLAVVPALAAALLWFKLRNRPKPKSIPEFCFGAVRVTDKEGRDMLIIRKEDGTFEMHEEKVIRRQCTL